MSTPVEHLRNLGPKSAHMLADVGIKTEADLRNVGVIDAYRRVKHAHPRRASLLMLYALQGALMDIHWNLVPDEIRADLKARLNK